MENGYIEVGDETVAEFPLPFKLRKFEIRPMETRRFRTSKLLYNRNQRSHEVVFQAKLQWKQGFFFFAFTGHLVYVKIDHSYGAVCLD